MNQIKTSASPVATPPEPEFSFNVGEAADSLERMCELCARFGDIYRVYSPSRRGYVYVINHPDDVKRVLVSNHSNYRKGFGLERVRMLLGNGIVTSDGELWRAQRHMMQPMFHRRIVTQFAAAIDGANDRLIERWERQAAHGEPINVTDEMSEVTLDFILRAIFGDDLDRLTQQMGQNPFDIITEDSARDLAFASRFYRLRKLVVEIIRRRRAQGWRDRRMLPNISREPHRRRRRATRAASAAQPGIRRWRLCSCSIPRSLEVWRCLLVAYSG